MVDLARIRVAVLATDGFEETELTEPVKALKRVGANVSIVSLRPGEIQAMKHDEKTIKVPVDKTIDAVGPDDFDAVQLPGGTLNADAMRAAPAVLSFLKAMEKAGKPMAFICHAAWEMISAGLVRGRTLTSYYTIQDDVRNAGGRWLDEDVVEDENWVSSRQPQDLPAFNAAMLALFAQAAMPAHP